MVSPPVEEALAKVVCPVTLNVVAVAVASVVSPVTVSLATVVVAKVEVPAVRVAIVPFVAVRSDAKSVDDVAAVNTGVSVSV